MSGQDTTLPQAAPAVGGIARSAPAYVLAILTAVSFFNYLDRMVIAILLEPIKHELKLSDAQMGLITGFAFAMVYATLGLPLARIADRRSRVVLMSACLAVWSAMTALTGLVRNFAQLFVVRMAVGIGEAGCGPAAHSLLGDLFPRERRAFAISVFQAGGALGQSVGLAVAAIVAHHWGWRAALMIVGLLGLPLAILLFTTVREPPRGEAHGGPPAESVVTALKALFSRAPLVYLILGISAASISSYGMLQWLPAFFIRSHGMSLTAVGLYVGAAKGGMGVLGTVAGGYVVSRLGRRDSRWELWWPMTIFAVTPLMTLASLAAPDWRVAIGIQVFEALIGAAAGGVALSAMQTYAEPNRRATALAVLLLLSSLLGLGLGPVVIGMISDALAPGFGRDSLRYALMATTVMPLIGSVLLWRASRLSKGWTLPGEDRAAAGT